VISSQEGKSRPFGRFFRKLLVDDAPGDDAEEAVVEVAEQGGGAEAKADEVLDREAALEVEAQLDLLCGCGEPAAFTVPVQGAVVSWPAEGELWVAPSTEGHLA
jgi:hypothetical protein